MTTSATRRRERVLIEDADKVVKKLRASPGVWHLIAVGELEEARILAQTAYRIRQNYRPDRNGIVRGLRAFAADGRGEFEAVSTADQRRPNKIAPVELSARYVLALD